MRKVWCGVMAVLAAALARGPAPAQPAGQPGPAVWFFSSLKADYTDLFTAPDRWPDALATIKVFKINPFFVNLSDDAGLKRVIDLLRDHRIALALEGSMLPPGPNGCGKGVEGYAEPGRMKAVATRLKALGADLRFISMDEPLWFGHVVTTFWLPNGGVCRAGLDALAADVARTVAEVRAVFPDVAVGDIEPMAGPDAVPPDYPALLRQWAEAVRRATGRPLAFVHFDLVWPQRPQEDGSGVGVWGPGLREAVRLLRADGLRVGFIYDGPYGDEPNAAWVDHAADLFRAVEGRLGLEPDDALLESWVARPDRVLPESEPGTMTSLVLRYAAWRRGRGVP